LIGSEFSRLKHIQGASRTKQSDPTVVENKVPDSQNS